MLGDELVVVRVVNAQNPHQLRLNSTRPVRALLKRSGQRIELTKMSPARVIPLDRSVLSIPLIDVPVGILPPRPSTSIATDRLWSNATDVRERGQITRRRNVWHPADLPGGAGRRRSLAIAKIDRNPPPASIPGRSPFVDIAAVLGRDYDDEQHVIVDRVDDAIVAYPYPPCGTATQRPGSRRTGILGQQRDRSLHSARDLSIEFA